LPAVAAVIVPDVPDATSLCVELALLTKLGPEPVDPEAVEVNAARVCALVPEMLCVPDAVDVNASRVCALVPVTELPDAVDVNAARVCAEVPETPCAPVAALVNAARVCALVPVTVEPDAVDVNASRVCALVPVTSAAVAANAFRAMTGRFGVPLPSRAICYHLPARCTATRGTTNLGGSGAATISTRHAEAPTFKGRVNTHVESAPAAS